MAVNWNCEHTVAFKEAMEYPGDSDEWSNFCAMRNTLVAALIAVKFPEGRWAITKDNWKAVFTRVHIWENAVGALRVGWTKQEGSQLEQADTRVPVDRYFEPKEIYDMIGFEVNAGVQSEDQLATMCVNVFKHSAQEKINKFVAEQEANDGS